MNKKRYRKLAKSDKMSQSKMKYFDKTFNNTDFKNRKANRF